MKTKKEVNYRKQNDLYKNRNKVCENCRNFFTVTPYKNRCTVMNTDLKDKTLAVHVDGTCDLFDGFNPEHNKDHTEDCNCQNCVNHYRTLKQTTPLQ